AGPELIRRWEQAPDPYGRAVITAAVDIHRLGVDSVLTRELLAAAAPGYMTPVQRGTAPSEWLDHGLTYATTPLHGGVSALVPIARTPGMVSGYHVADYLVQHAAGTRRGVPLPDTVWHALHDHLIDGGALVRAGQAAEKRLLFQHAEGLYTAGML